jgi:ectoine hydroxylase-related dioxygenase (phytanoyl-CoA dioxygenase family)
MSAEERAAFDRSFAESGYFVFKNVVSADALAALHKRVDEAFERAGRDGSLFEGGGQISGHLNCFPGAESRFAYDAVERFGVIDLVRRELPGLNGALRVGLNYNLPNSHAQHYHVDSSFLDRFMIVNVAVVDTDVVNGAIDVLPGTHVRFYRYWEFAVRRLSRLTTRIPMKAGDVLVRSSNLWHRGMPNRAAAARPMLAFTFGERVAESDTRDPFSVTAGKISFHPNWYRPTLAGRLRERTFVAAPITYAAYRFVRSLVGSKGYGSTLQ